MNYRFFGKRLLDLALCTVLAPVALPVCIVISILLPFHQGFPIFYLAYRPGLHSRLFRPVKFRTMRNLGIGENPHSAQRLTPIGSLLRKTSIDELPQIWNILLGQMSFVGPRPLLPEYLPLYNDRQLIRQSVKPGLTGLVQVNGRNALDWPSRLELDAQYVDRCSLSLDLSIMWHTLRLILRGQLGEYDSVAPSQPFHGDMDLNSNK